MSFNSISELYSFLEDNDMDLRYHSETTRKFLALANEVTEQQDKDTIKWEIYVFDFTLSKGKVKPVYSITKKDGSIYSYPSYKEFSEEGYLYLVKRSKSVKNDFLVARYNQILWNSPSKHKNQQQAKDAIDAYLRIINNFNCINEEKKKSKDCLEIFKNGIELAFQVKYKVEEYKDFMHLLLFEKNKLDPVSKILLLMYMINQEKFKNNDFKNCLNLVQTIGAAKSKINSDFHWQMEIFKTGLQISNKLKVEIKLWNKRVGDSFVKFADSRLDDETRIVPLKYYKEAIIYYKAAKQDRKVKELENKYFEIKKELKLTSIRYKIPSEQASILSQNIKDQTNELLKKTPKQIFTFLSHGNSIFPSMEQLSRLDNGKDSFLNSLTGFGFDINKNIIKEKRTKIEIENKQLHDNFGFYLRMHILPILHEIFIEGIKSGKLTYETLLKYIYEETWFGQEITDFDSTGELIRYSWISLIAPSLFEYFYQTEAAMKSNYPYANYIMPIDSLTLKFEGVLRDFAKLAKVSTTTLTKGEILREKYIEELLEEEKIKKYFDAKDIFFFKHLFVSKDGLNLRNNIAHSFFHDHNYSFNLMHLLICAFLRIGKYRLMENL